MLCPSCNETRFPSKRSDTAVKIIDDNCMPNQTVNNDDPVIPRGIQKVVIEPTLAYIWFSMQSGTFDNVKTVAVSHFSLEAVVAAKNTLWEASDNSVIGEKFRRRGTAARNEKVAHINDIVEALSKLDQAGKVPTLAIDALSLGFIPRAKPEELNDISVIERLTKVEQLVKSLYETTDKLMCENMSIQDKLKSPTYADVASSMSDSIPLMQNPQPHTAGGKDHTGVHTANTRQSRGRGGPHARGSLPSGRGGWLCHSTSRGRGRMAQPVRATTFASSNPFDPLQAEFRAISSDRQSTHSDAPSHTSYHNSTRDDSEGFQLPTQQIKRKMRRVIAGQADTSRISGFKGAPEPERDLFIFRVDPETETDQLKEYLCEKGITSRKLECVSNINAKFKSFKLSVPASEFSKLFNEDLWPCGVRVRKYITPRSSW